MTNGYYFLLNEKSNFTKGQVQFYYTAIQGYKGANYPVYVTFNNDSVNFYFNGFVQNEDAEIEFIETKLFSLHLYNDIFTKEQLNSTLKNLYAKKFPVLKNYFLLENTKTPITLKTFKDLAIFSPQEIDDKLNYKNVLLDFLFDLKHSNVFDNDPSFNKVKHLIKESFFLQAIAKKVNYYYHTENNNEIITFNIKNNKYKDRLISAQKKWLDLIDNEESPKIINKKNNWFNDVEKEVNDTFKKTIKNGESNENFKEYEQTLFENKLKFSKWFIQRNNILKAWFIFNKLRWLFGISLALIFYVIISVIRKINGYKPFIPLEEWNVKKWLVCFILLIIAIGVFSTFFDKKKSFLGKLPKFYSLFINLWMIPLWVLLFGSSMIVFEISSYYNREYIQNNWTFRSGYMIIFLLILITIYKLVLFFFEKYINEKREKDVCLFPKVMIKRIKLFNITFLYIIFIIILFFYFKNFILSIKSVYIAFSLCLLILIIFILYNNERERHKHLINSTSISKTLSMLFYGLVISFFVNLAIYHTLYKEYLEQYQYLGYIWEHTAPKEKKHTNNTEEDIWFQYSGDKFHEIEEYAKKPMSDKVNVYIDEYFFEELTKVRFINKECSMAKHEEHQKSNKASYQNANPTILKKVKINGFEFYAIPSVIFINTLLSLLVAVVLQIILHRKKFLEGGEAE